VERQVHCCHWVSSIQFTSPQLVDFRGIITRNPPSLKCPFTLTDDLCLARFQVLTVVCTKMAVIWVETPCNLIEVYQRSRGPYCLHRFDDGDSKYIRNVGKLLPDFSALQRRRQPYSILVRVFPPVNPDPWSPTVRTDLDKMLEVTNYILQTFPWKVIVNQLARNFLKMNVFWDVGAALSGTVLGAKS
jgi:hypothetical protein